MSSEFYNRFIRENAKIISKICRAYTDSADDYHDYFQEVCLQLWRSRESFQNKSAVSTWVYRVTLNCCLTLFKNHKRRVATTEIKESVIQVPQQDAAELEQLDMLYAAIRQLKEMDRALIILYLEEKSYKEIAEILGTNANHIGVRINRIKNTLKEIINGESRNRKDVETRLSTSAG